MLKRLIPVLICLFAASAAQAQMGGGGGGGHGRGGGGRRPPATSKPADPSAPAPGAPTPVNQIEIIGVIKGIDAQTEQLTIAYEPVEGLNWPAGTMPFIVAKKALMAGATVGEKVRFSVDSGQISALRPF